MSTRSPRSSPRRLGQWLGLSLLGANLLVAGIAAWAIHNSLVRHRHQAEITTRNLAAILEQNLAGEIHQIDLTLLQILDELDRLPSSPDLLEARLERHLVRVPWLSSLRVADAEGQMVAGAGSHPSAALNLSDRPYFNALREASSSELLISSPLISHVDGNSILVFARRRTTTAGRFAGVVYGAVTPAAFSRALGIVDIGPHGSIAVRNTENRLLTRHPADPRLDARIGEQTRQAEYLAVVASPAKMGTFRTSSPTDGVVRTWTVRAVADQPLWLIVGLAESDYLLPWRGDVWKAGGTMAGTLLLSLILGTLVLRATRRQVAAQEALALEKEKFQTLTEQTDDVIWSTTPEGRFTYVSPSVFTQQGFTPEEMMVLPRDIALAGPGPRAFMDALQAEVNACPPGTQPFPTQGLEVEQRRKDGSTFPAEVRLTLIWGPDGELRGIRGITRDISQQKQIQAEKEALIQDLTLLLAEVKSLKGMLPICSGCKKIRDDQGYWNQIESYLSQHTDATFTHGMCPECAERFFPEMSTRRKSGTELEND